MTEQRRVTNVDSRLEVIHARCSGSLAVTPVTRIPGEPVCRHPRRYWVTLRRVPEGVLRRCTNCGAEWIGAGVVE